MVHGIYRRLCLRVGTTDWRFVIGVALAIGGGALNIWSDYRLWRLRRDNEDEYVIPRGGVFNLVSCPNLLGEIIEWVGFALLSWSLPGPRVCHVDDCKHGAEGTLAPRLVSRDI